MHGGGQEVCGRNPISSFCHCLQRERKKQEEQLSLTMDLPLISHGSKGLIQSPGSLEAVFKQTSQDMFILMADIPFFCLERFVSLSIRRYMM